MLAAEADRVVAPVGHRRGVDGFAVDARAVLEAGERAAGLADRERRARVEVERERDVEIELGGQLVEAGAGTDDRPLGFPEALGRLELDAPTALPNGEHLGGDELIRKRGGEPVDCRANVDGAAELVEKRLVLRRGERGERGDLLVTIQQPSRHAGGLERGGALADVWPADQNALGTEQRSAELLLEPNPLLTRANGEPSEPLVVVTMTKDARATGRLTRTRNPRFEHTATNTTSPKRISSRKPTDAGAGNSHLSGLNAHAATVRLGATIKHRGAVAKRLRHRSPKPGIPGSNPGCPASVRAIRSPPAGE